ncbi:MAG TPA: tripartite tricarboxylate transporter substrate binding protein [Pseudolabrys sp.]|jgi:tripartite-type tricarboxylate transporter receptor subunit TctC
MRRRSFVSGLIGLAAAAALSAAAFAQNYPNRPVAIVVPFAAGGAFDVLARVLAPRMGEVLGQQVLVENVTGASGILGSSRVAHATPDGYTMLLASIGTHAYNPSIYPKLAYDAAGDFTPVGLVAEQPMVLVARTDLPVANLKEFIAYVKANHAKMQFGSAGIGSTTHLACALLNSAMGEHPVHVPYRGGGPAMAEIVAGRIDYGCFNTGGVAAQIKAGHLKAIATLSRERAAILPELPSAHEQGLADFNVTTWNALLLPKGTPPQIVTKLNEAMSKTLDTPAVQELLAKYGMTGVAPERRTPAYLAKFIPEEIARWAGPIKAAGIQPDK